MAYTCPFCRQTSSGVLTDREDGFGIELCPACGKIVGGAAGAQHVGEEYVFAPEPPIDYIESTLVVLSPLMAIAAMIWFAYSPHNEPSMQQNVALYWLVGVVFLFAFFGLPVSDHLTRRSASVLLGSVAGAIAVLASS